MELTVITLTLLGITVASFLVGSIWLAKFAFRLSAGQGIGVLLFPPYTFYFAFYQLDNDAKDRPTALWMFGLVASIFGVFLGGWLVKHVGVMRALWIAGFMQMFSNLVFVFQSLAGHNLTLLVATIGVENLCGGIGTAAAADDAAAVLAS